MSINIKRLISKTFDANCYIVSKGNQAVIIDPCVSVERIKEELEDKKLVGILLTHGHFDHILHLENILKHYQVKVYLHHNAIEKLADHRKNYSAILPEKIKVVLDENLVVTVNHLQKITFDNDFEFSILHTPGHTNCSVCYLIDNQLFSGDTLFKENIGRSDLYTGDFEVLKQSLNLLKSLDNEIIIYPGHGDKSTIKHEKTYNYYFKD